MDFRSELPANFHNSPLRGEQWQIAWALKNAGILRKGTPKELSNKVAKQEALWGKNSGRTYFVYVHTNFGAVRIERALAALEQIKVRGPYHPEWHQLPRAFSVHRCRPLEARSEQVLAQVLHQAGILESATVSALHSVIENKGGLFGKYRDSGFALYLNDKHEAQVVSKTQQLLASALSSVNPAVTENQGRFPPGPLANDHNHP